MGRQGFRSGGVKGWYGVVEALGLWESRGSGV